MAEKKKNKIWILFVILASVSCCCLIMLQPIGDYLVVQDEIQKTDLIAAVSGPEYRILYASELYMKGLANKVFFTGGFSEENNRIEASWSKYVAETHGVPGEAIAIDENVVLTTHDEAVLLKNYIDAHTDEVKSVTLVTDPWHSRRARWIYQKVLGEEIKVFTAPVPRMRTGFPKYWWTEASSRKLVWNEYVKLVFYVFRYQIATGHFRSWLSQFDKF